MTQTVYGVALDSLGQARDGSRYWSTPSALLRTVQDPTIPIRVEHGRECGEVIFIERAHGNVMIVAEIDDSVSEEMIVRIYSPPPTTPLELTKPEPELRSVAAPLFWSVERIGDFDEGFLLLGVALTSSPARVGARPVTFREGSAHMAGYTSSDSWERQLLKRAHEYDLRRHGAPLVVQGEHPQPRVMPVLELASARQPLEIRSAAAVDVHISRREVDVLIGPAEQPTLIHERGRSFLEVMSHGCFAGCENEPERVKVNMHHQRERLVGRALQLDPWSEAGLEGTLKLAKTAAADEAIALIEDDLLGVSAGFAIKPNGDEWTHDQQQRRVKRATLHHVALVDQAAYEAARVTAIRGDLAGVS